MALDRGDAGQGTDECLNTVDEALRWGGTGLDVDGNSCTAAASKAAARAAMVLADVLKRSDERSGDLAVYADQSHGRGVTCEQAYDGISK